MSQVLISAVFFFIRIKVAKYVHAFFLLKENQENKAVLSTPEMFLLLHLFKAIFDYFIGVDYYTQNLKTNSDFTV